MAITINGAGTITGISTGGLPNGVIVNDDIANTTITEAKLHDSLDLSGKTVTLPAGTGGKILQVATVAFTSRFSASSGQSNWVDVTGFKIDFTPQSASSTIIVQIALGRSTGSSNSSAFKVIRDTTDVMVGDSFGSSPSGAFTNMGSGSFSGNHCYGNHWTGFESSPGTSQVEYQLQYMSQGNATTCINQSASLDNYNDSYALSGSSSMVIWEVG
jgi:hypothetical protein